MRLLQAERVSLQSEPVKHYQKTHTVGSLPDRLDCDGVAALLQTCTKVNNYLATRKATKPDSDGSYDTASGICTHRQGAFLSNCVPDLHFVARHIAHDERLARCDRTVENRHTTVV